MEPEGSLPYSQVPITIKKCTTNLGSAGRAPFLRVTPWLRKKHGKKLRVAARTSQADTVLYNEIGQHNAQKKNSNTEQHNVTEQYRTPNKQQRKQSYPVRKPRDYNPQHSREHSC
jgi:hypothetical protein